MGRGRYLRKLVPSNPSPSIKRPLVKSLVPKLLVRYSLGINHSGLQAKSMLPEYNSIKSMGKS
jgi:hypothetical protein